MNLADLKTGEKAVITKVRGRGAFRKRIIEMGFVVGKQVIVVANLKPAKLMGVVSNGMLVAAVDESGPILATLDKPVEPGTPLR